MSHVNFSTNSSALRSGKSVKDDTIKLPNASNLSAGVRMRGAATAGCAKCAIDRMVRFEWFNELCGSESFSCKSAVLFEEAHGSAINGDFERLRFNELMFLNEIFGDRCLLVCCWLDVSASSDIAWLSLSLSLSSTLIEWKNRFEI